MLVHIFFLIYALNCQMELVKSADKLEYWEPNPKYDSRRAIQEKYKNHPNNAPDHDSKFKFNKVKTKNKSQKSGDLKPMLGGPNMNKMERLKRKGHPQPDLEPHRHEDNTKWPKLQQRRYKKQGRNEEIRSTRMTPLYLMQKSGEETSTTAYPLQEDKEINIEELSPYSIKTQMTELAGNVHEANITVEVIGRTVEYNDIVLLKMTERKSDLGKYFRADESKYVDEVPEKKIIFIVHGLSVMGIHSLNCLKKMSEFKKILSYYYAYLDKFDIFLIPMANPDGYAAKGHFWNKNMSPQGACPGVNLDRNFDVAWNSTSSVSSCSQHFPGIAPFSEQETRAIREILHHYSHKIVGYFHVHSGAYNSQIFKGDAVLYPKGYTDVQSDDDKYIDLRGEIDEAMKNASFQIITVTVDTLHNWYGKISGSSVDYAATVYGIPYALELVMQPYEDKSEEYSVAALNELWRRVIEVIFNSIWQNTKNSDT